MRSWVVAGAVAALVVAANASHGAYFSQSWGWVALAFLSASAFALILGWAVAPGRLRVAFAVLMTALGLWVAASGLWSLSAPASAREVERVLVYVALAGAIAFVLRRRDADALAAGLFAGVVPIAAYALAARLFPEWLETPDDDFSNYRLSEPIGYWNALGLFAALGLLLGVGFVAHARRVPYVVASGAALPVLSATLYFTYSRGAWIALGLGATALVLLDPRRLRLLWSGLVVLPASAIGVAVASQQEALTTLDVPAADVTEQGRGLAAVIAALVLGSASLAAIARVVANRLNVRQRGRRAVDVALAMVAVAAAVVAVAVNGGPAGALGKLRDRFESDPITGPNLNARLFTVSGNGREQSLGVAWDAARERPIVGHGAGSYEYIWYEDRSSGLDIRDAHSLYAETLAELGIVGLALLVGVLVMPLAAAIRARRVRVVPGAMAAYVTWIAASALDWHWEMVGVTLVALLAGGVTLLSQERGQPRPLRDAARGLLLVPAVGLTILAVVSLVGNQALFAGREALERREWAEAAEHGHRAEAILRWSIEPDLVIGDAAAGAGNLEAALERYRAAARRDDRRWVIWFRVAQAASGRERRAALQRIRDLNPREEVELVARP